MRRMRLLRAVFARLRQLCHSLQFPYANMDPFVSEGLWAWEEEEAAVVLVVAGVECSG
jgi:hypothetical protein